jgi:hypothetical protein
VNAPSRGDTGKQCMYPLLLVEAATHLQAFAKSQSDISSKKDSSPGSFGLTCTTPSSPGEIGSHAAHGAMLSEDSVKQNNGHRPGACDHFRDNVPDMSTSFIMPWDIAPINHLHTGFRDVAPQEKSDASSPRSADDASCGPFTSTKTSTASDDDSNEVGGDSRIPGTPSLRNPAHSTNNTTPVLASSSLSEETPVVTELAIEYDEKWMTSL